MTRMTIGVMLSGLLLAGSAAAQAPAAPRTTPPAPAAQTPGRAGGPATPPPAIPTGQPPAAQPPAPRPAPAPFPADAKFGFVNMQTVVSESKMGKLGSDQMKVLNDKKDAELALKQRDVTAKQQEIQGSQSVWTSGVLAQKNAELQKAQSELQFMQQQKDLELSNLNDQLLNEFGEKVIPIVEQIRAEKNLLVVFSVDTTGNSTAGLTVVALQPGLDLSMEVVRRLDAAPAK